MNSSICGVGGPASCEKARSAYLIELDGGPDAKKMIGAKRDGMNSSICGVGGPASCEKARSAYLIELDGGPDAKKRSLQCQLAVPFSKT
jgi:hypothetical protein